tara:strand:+ start:3486 stop:3770 length:285 start_codon:yes stop_codon:yes gene_type:complete
MKEPENTTAAILEINGVKLALKARPDDNDMNPSGWSVIAFAPSASVRCVRAHQRKHLEFFIRCVVTLSGLPPNDPDAFEKIEEELHRITRYEFE